MEDKKCGSENNDSKKSKDKVHIINSNIENLANSLRSFLDSLDGVPVEDQKNIYNQLLNLDKSLQAVAYYLRYSFIGRGVVIKTQNKTKFLVTHDEHGRLIVDVIT